MAEDNQQKISGLLRAVADSAKVKRFYNSGDGRVNELGFGEYVSLPNQIKNNEDTGNFVSKSLAVGAGGSAVASLAATLSRVGVNAAHSKGLSLLKPAAKSAYGAAAAARKVAGLVTGKYIQMPVGELAATMSANGYRAGTVLGRAANWRNMIVGGRALGAGAKMAKFAKYSKFIKGAGPIGTLVGMVASGIASNAELHAKYDPDKQPMYHSGELGEDIPGYRIGSRAGLVNPNGVGNNIIGTLSDFVHSTVSMFDGASNIPGNTARGIYKLFGASDKKADAVKQDMDLVTRIYKKIFLGGNGENPLNPIKKITKEATVNGGVDPDEVYGNDMRGRMMADLFVRAKMRGMEGVPNSYVAVNSAEREAAELYKEGKLEKTALDQTPAEIFYNPSKERGYNKDPMMNMAAYYPGDDRYPVYMHTLRKAYAEKHAGNNPNSADYKKFEQVFDSYLSSTATNRGGVNETTRDEIRKEAFDFYHQKRKAAAEKQYEPVKK